MHVHAVEGDAECKYWLHPDRFDIVEDFEYNCTPRLRREVRQIILEHFDQIVASRREIGSAPPQFRQSGRENFRIRPPDWEFWANRPQKSLLTRLPQSPPSSPPIPAEARKPP